MVQQKNEQKQKTRTSAEVKNRYNAKAYDRIAVVVKKGEKDLIKSHADALGLSLNAYITGLIYKDLNI
jgi:hypothetical protein